MTNPPTNVVFDVGNVLLRWDPRHLYRKIFDEEEKMEWFLSTICTPEWNIEQDRGRGWEEAVALLVEKHPEHETPIRAFHERWGETVSGVDRGECRGAQRTSRCQRRDLLHHQLLRRRSSRRRERAFRFSPASTASSCRATNGS